ncbi:DUF7019 family protein [Streptomyces sp. NPDC002446]
MAFRYYLYVSDTKVDMLLAQLDPGFDRKSSTEWGVQLPPFSARRTVERAPVRRFERLDHVVRHLDDFGDVGTVDEPGAFFRGHLAMQWGHLPSGESGSGHSGVFFTGRTERTTVGLGGSGVHVVGAGGAGAAEQSVALAGSVLPAVLAGLAAEGDGDANGPLGEAGGEEAALATVRQACAALRGPAQTVEFLAKRLISGPSPYPELDGGRGVLLGSPLYVALVD